MQGSKRSVDIEADTYKLHEGFCTFTWMGINILSLPLSGIGRIQIKDSSMTEKEQKEFRERITKEFKK